MRRVDVFKEWSRILWFNLWLYLCICSCFKTGTDLLFFLLFIIVLIAGW